MEEGDVEKLIGWGLGLLNKVNYRDRYVLCGGNSKCELDVFQWFRHRTKWVLKFGKLFYFT